MSGGHCVYVVWLTQLIFIVVGQQNARLDITPTSFHVSQAVTNVTIMCKAGFSKLRGCQFTWTDQLNNPGPILDLSQGNASRMNVSLLSSHLIGYSYHGGGLDKGECGIEITIRGWKLWMLGCRAHSLHGGWRYAWMSLVARDFKPISLVATPREVAVLPGGNVSLMCRARNEALTACKFKHPRSLSFLDFSEGNKSLNSNGSHLYHGKGLRKGECGLKLVNVSDLDNGPFICDISTSTGGDQRHIPVIVARQPSPPVLDLLISSISEGDYLKAKCTVAHSRPVVGITWLLENNVIRRDKFHDGPLNAEDIWKWPWDLTSISQNISHKLRRDHNGKVLRCLVHDMSLTRSFEVSKKILYTPRKEDDNVRDALHTTPDPSSFSLSASPAHVRIDKLTNTVTFNCNANVPLIGCQFHWISSENASTPIVDCSKGNQTETNATALAHGVNHYSYNSSGLEAGKCSITMKLKGYKTWVVGCRVQPRQGGWKYEVMDLFAKSAGTRPVTVSPKTSVVLPGESLSVMCSTPRPQGCYFTVPGYSTKLNFTLGPNSPNSTHPHFYEGRGLGSGECGLKLTNVTEANNGIASCLFISENKVQEIGYFLIIVAKSPQAPVLSVNSGTHVDETLTASCSVAGSRPQPTIRWLLNNIILRQDSSNDAPSNLDDQWMWPWSTASLHQNLTYKTSPKDHGKTLKCEVSHITLAKPLEAVHRIAVSNKTQYCKRLRSTSLDMSCAYKHKPVTCNSRQLPTTEALLTCKEGFSSATEETYRTITCLENGQWSNKQLNCVTGCGLRSSVQEFISGGAEAELKDHPWHVGVYLKQNGTSYTHICGGTLISTTYVISAAHCFWDSTAERPSDEEHYMISAGKRKRQWGPKEDNEQRKHLDKIFMHERYRHKTTHLRYDIAVVRLRSPVKISAVVKLVCLDWREEVMHEQLVDGNKGTVAGWGIKEGGTYSDVLLAVELPYVSYILCLDALPTPARAWLTFDKFCAGYKDKNTSVCRGDSGGGIIFRQRSTGRFFLQGIVSTNFKTATTTSSECYAQLYTSFTQISLYYDWIKKIISI